MPKLPPFTYVQLGDIFMSNNSFLLRNKNIKILRDIWNNKTIYIDKYLCRACVVRFNKRIWKFLFNHNSEKQQFSALYLNSLNQDSWVNSKIKLNSLQFEQNGFVNERGTQFNIEKLIKKRRASYQLTSQMLIALYIKKASTKFQFIRIYQGMMKDLLKKLHSQEDSQKGLNLISKEVLQRNYKITKIKPK